MQYDRQRAPTQTPMELAEALQFHQRGHRDLAERGYREILQRDPTNALAWHLLGMLLVESRRPDEALDCLQRSVTLNPSEAQFRSNLSAVLGMMGRYEESLEHACQAARLNPASRDVFNNLGVTLERCRRFDEAAEAFRRAAECDPSSPVAQTHLANVLRKMGWYARALAAYRRAVSIKPTARGYATLASCLADMGDQTETIAARRRAVELEPQDAATHSDLLLDLLHDESTTPQMQLAESLEWARRHVSAFGHEPRFSPAQLSHSARLRVGYVSADLRNHPVARFFEPVLASHDRTRFEVFCYSSSRKKPDATTERLKQLAEHWRDIAELSDDQAADLVRQDGIHILVDLGGHTGSNRLLLFARCPAPVQVSYLGYPATTGLSQIQYRITDEVADPPGCEQFYSEQLVRLPGCAWCYLPSPSAPPVGPLPADSVGHVTFAALHRQQKITPTTVQMWADILAAVPNSRLLVSCAKLCADDGSIKERISGFGIDPRRVELVSRAAHDEYLRAYMRADLALDAFPYNGTTTTCDALWMGVPVASLAGESHVSRTTASLLSAVGVDELARFTAADYVQAVIALAADWSRLRQVRSFLRTRMSQSPLMDAAACTRNLESMYLRFLADFEAGPHC